METLALEVKHLTLAWIKAQVVIEGNEQADQAAKEGAAGGLHLKETQTPIPWQIAKSKIEDFFCKGALFRGKGGPPVLE